MSGICSVHLHYERYCGLCQSGKPVWVTTLEAQLTAALAERDAARKDSERLAGAVAGFQGLIDSGALMTRPGLTIAARQRCVEVGIDITEALAAHESLTPGLGEQTA